EDRVQRRARHGPLGAAVLMQELDTAREPRAARGIQVHADPARRADVVDELAPPASQLEHRAIVRDVPLKDGVDEHAPDAIAVARLRGKAPFVLARQLLTHGCAPTEADGGNGTTSQTEIRSNGEHPVVFM